MDFLREYGLVFIMESGLCGLRVGVVAVRDGLGIR